MDRVSMEMEERTRNGGLGQVGPRSGRRTAGVASVGCHETSAYGRAATGESVCNCVDDLCSSGTVADGNTAGLQNQQQTAAIGWTKTALDNAACFVTVASAVAAARVLDPGTVSISSGSRRQLARERDVRGKVTASGGASCGVKTRSTMVSVQMEIQNGFPWNIRRHKSTPTATTTMTTLLEEQVDPRAQVSASSTALVAVDPRDPWKLQKSYGSSRSPDCESDSGRSAGSGISSSGSGFDDMLWIPRDTSLDRRRASSPGEYVEVEDCRSSTREMGLVERTFRKYKRLLGLGKSKSSSAMKKTVTSESCISEMESLASMDGDTMSGTMSPYGTVTPSQSSFTSSSGNETDSSVSDNSSQIAQSVSEEDSHVGLRPGATSKPAPPVWPGHQPTLSISSQSTDSVSTTTSQRASFSSSNDLPYRLSSSGSSLAYSDNSINMHNTIDMSSSSGSSGSSESVIRRADQSDSPPSSLPPYPSPVDMPSSMLSSPPPFPSPSPPVPCGFVDDSSMDISPIMESRGLHHGLQMELVAREALQMSYRQKVSGLASKQKTRVVGGGAGGDSSGVVRGALRCHGTAPDSSGGTAGTGHRNSEVPDSSFNPVTSNNSNPPGKCRRNTRSLHRRSSNNSSDSSNASIVTTKVLAGSGAARALSASTVIPAALTGSPTHSTAATAAAAAAVTSRGSVGEVVEHPATTPSKSSQHCQRHHCHQEQSSLRLRMVRRIAKEFLTDERDRQYYADNCSCFPPPLFMPAVTILEIITFVYYALEAGDVSPKGPIPADSLFIYRPDKRFQIWRFIFYMLIHAGWVHLFFNMLVQLLVGVPLEMVHGSFRIGAVYMAGVLAGSLGTSVFDMDAVLVGASGGVYALLAAHLANILLNYSEMELGILKLAAVFIIAGADVGFAVWDRYTSGGDDGTSLLVSGTDQHQQHKEDQLHSMMDIGGVGVVAEALDPGGPPPASYVAHLMGALAGLTIGLLVLKNFEQKLHVQVLWWVALGVYSACTIFAVLWNVFYY